MSEPRSVASARPVQLLDFSQALVRAFLALLLVPLLTAVAASIHIPIPGVPVPFTLQTVVVVLSGVALGATWGPLSMLAYLLYGVVGLPFFALGDGTGGFSYLLGITGGYLLTFPLAASLVGRLAADPSRVRSTGRRFLVLLAGSVLILAGGTLFALAFHEVEAVQAATTLFLVFLPLEVAKSAAAAVVWRPRRS